MLGALGKGGQIEMGQCRQVARIIANHSHGKRGGD